MGRRVQGGPEGRAGWKDEWSWRDKKGVWRKRTIYGSGVAKLDVEEASTARPAPKHPVRHNRDPGYWRGGRGKGRFRRP